MNNDELDARLRSASHTPDVSASPDVLNRAVHARRRPIRDLMSTSSPATRRNAIGTVAGAAALAIAVPMLFPSQQALFSLAEGAPNASAVGDAEGLSTSDSKMMMPFITYNYIAGADLSTAAGSGTVYRFELVGDVQSRARAIADELGLDGTVTKSSYFDKNYPRWVVGPEDGSAANLTVYWSGTGSWWYNNPAAYPAQECIDPAQSGSDTPETCNEYAAPPSGKNPSQSEAEDTALAIFSALGFDGSADSLTTYRDEWGTTVTAAQSVAGQRVAVDWSISWSGDGEIAYMSGHSARAAAAGNFPTVSAVDAVARMSDWRWYGSAPMDGMPWMSSRSYGVEGDAVAATESEPAVEPTSEPSVDPTAEPAPDVTSEPMPTETFDPGLTPEPLPTPTVMDLIINKAKPQLLIVWDKSGGVWLVPGFVMSGSEGWPMAVISLIEGIIELPEPMPIEPAIID
jgi:hypothetical protein